MAGDAKSVVPGKICMSTTSNRGANDDDLNLITLCADCHEALHRSC
jgi:predicted HNH restriction endonuclease